MAPLLRRLRIPGYVIASVIISLSGILAGFDTGSIGAITVMSNFEKTFGRLAPTVQGFTVSLIMLTGAVPSLFAGQLADRFGRLRIVGLGASVFTVAAILQGTASKLAMFLVGRALAGLGVGTWMSNVSVYICEISPSARRGMLVSTPQFMSTAGICLGYFTCYGTVHFDSSMSWRTPFVIQAILGALLAVSCKFLPESPRWLVLHDRREDAMRQIERLGMQQAEAEKDILTVQDSDLVGLERSPIQGLLMLFRRQYRVRTLLALFILGMVQLSGIDGVLYYAPILFEQAGLPGQTASFLASGVSAILMLIVAIPALLFADSWNRRTSVITGGIGLSSCMLIIGSLYASNSVHNFGIGRWVVIVLIFVFALTYCATWGVVAKIYASEIQPSQTRAAANCVAQGLGFLTNWLVAFATPVFLAKSSYGPYFLYGGLSLATVVILGAYMPETKGKPLESIQEAFQTPLLKSWAHYTRRLVSDRHAVGSNSEVSGSGTTESIELSALAVGTSLRVEAA